jgi:hypothetical protein
LEKADVGIHGNDFKTRIGNVSLDRSACETAMAT